MAEDSETANFHRQYDRQIRLWGLAAQQRMSGTCALLLVFSEETTCLPSFSQRVFSRTRDPRRATGERIT